MNREHVLMMMIACLPGATAMAGEEVIFMQFPAGAGGVSDITPDGSIIVGSGSGGGFYWRWQEDPVPTFIGGNDASGVSDDGSVIVGCIDDPADGAEVAAMWTEETGWQSLGYLPDALTCPSRSNAYDVSADGTVVTGLSWEGCNGLAFLWTEETGMIALEELGNGVNRASVISDDGTAIGGFAQGSFSRTPARWTAEGPGVMWDFDSLGEVGAVNADGSRLSGSFEGRAFTWTEDEGMTILDEISPVWTGRVLGATPDNSLMVGFEFFSLARDAMVWNGEGDIARLQQVLINLGVKDVPQLDVAVDVSADGRTIIGHTAFQGAWLVHFPADNCPADIDGDGEVGFSDLLAVITAWGPCPGCPEDLDGNDAVEFADLLVVLTEWGPCP